MSFIKKLGPILESQDNEISASLKTSLLREKISNIDQDENSDNLYFNQFFIKIKDTGQGISKEGLDKLFVDFGSLKEHMNSNHRGTGLGLSICK